MTDNVDGLDSAPPDSTSANPIGVGENPGPPLRDLCPLSQNAPNPFARATRLRYSVAEEGRVHLAIFDVTGRKVATLVDCRVRAGEHTVSWSGTADSGRPAMTGLYFARLEVAGKAFTRRLLLVR